MSQEGPGQRRPPSDRPGRPAHFASVARVFHELSPRLRRFAFSLGASEAEADEVVSATFESYLNFLDRNPEGVRNHEAYLVSIARNAFSRLKRETPDHVSVEEGHELQPQEFHDTLVRELEHTLLGRALQRVSEEDRLLLTLRLLEDKTTNEVAAELSITPVNARARLTRARRALRTEYLLLYADTSSATSCADFIRPLAKFVAHGSGAPPRRLAKHLAGCTSCSRVLEELRDEASAGRRARAIIWGPVGLAALQQLVPRNGERAQSANMLSIHRSLVTLGLTLVTVLGAAQLLGPSGPGPSGLGGPAAGDKSWSTMERGGLEQPWLSVYPETTQVQMPAPGHEVEWELGARNDSLLSTFHVQLQVVNKDAHFTDLLRLTVETSTRKIIDSAPLASLKESGGTIGLLAPGEELSLHAKLARDGSDDDPELSTELTFQFTTLDSASAGEAALADGNETAVGLHPLDSLILALTGRMLGGALAAFAAALIVVGLGSALWRRSRLLGEERNRAAGEIVDSALQGDEAIGFEAPGPAK